ncbi:glycoside hydrolase family 2 protein [Microbacterium terricola]|uniref:beta-mannosidase n=1 Tax=Microbacterium terricola TaxID=344163 RepID=A0ABM8DW83_9MICO|nr:glycoside hydrolase family 2 protein [Microbacterium terricola]UYK39354.1 glycoside hydrolase family 2 protein [Microbacterium terricola]BDV29923.1 beta-mannosidase [Microbacterium terricola]
MTSLSSRTIHDGWTARAASGPAPAEVSAQTLPAAVPGCIHVDLLDAGLIPDPYQGANEALVAWIGLVDWTFETTFAWSPDGHTRQDLVFEGLDTVAAIRLNGRLLGETANQHRSYRFDVGPLLVDGDNHLEVAFRAPVPYANLQSVALGARPRPYPLPYEAIRKSACNFGWDWGIATFTTGIWKPVRLESWSGARLAEVRITAAPEGDGGAVEADVVIERDAADLPVSVSLQVTGPGLDADAPPAAAAPVDGDRVHVRLALAAAERWWPAGYGEQPRYVVDVRLDGDETVDAAQRVVGFRTVEWDTTADAAGSAFTLVVNDQPIFVKGVNWIPDDALPVRVDRARVERRLRQALDANLNLIRVWGGGLYESEDFYDLADELGLLTWQDFLFACAGYPEEEPLRSEIEAEARENVVRLASHPSLVLLTGNNEALEGFEDWGWKQRLDGRSWGAHYYYELFPRVIGELAPHVPYIPGSPFSSGMGWDPAPTADSPSGTQTGPHPLDPGSGTVHLWRQWNDRDWTTYREHTPRFVAEFGWQGPPSWTTLTGSLDDAPLTPESPGMIVHQKAMEGNVKLTNGLLPHFRVPDDMETWHWAMQLNQALAVGAALDHFRSWAPHTMGAIVWQLNDCWPVTSWAAIDGGERPKPLFHALRNSFAARVVTIQPRDGALAVVLGNDTDEEWTGPVQVRRLSFAGEALAGITVQATVPARGSLVVPIDRGVATSTGDESQLLVAEAPGARGLWFFAEPRDSALPAQDLVLEARRVDGGTEVTVTARSLARDVTLLVDKVHPSAHAEDGLITLLPGESARILVRHDGELDARALADPRVLRSANQLVRA